MANLCADNKPVSDVVINASCASFDLHIDQCNKPCEYNSITSSSKLFKLIVADIFAIVTNVFSLNNCTHSDHFE